MNPDLTNKDLACITIKACADATEFAALAQQMKAEWYLGKRVQFSAALRAENTSNRAAMFTRIGGPNGKMLVFDNMKNRFISGSKDWERHDIVLDVAEEADNIVFGVLLSLEGQIWMADVHLGVVDKSAPTTDILEEIAPFFPVNLDFTE